MDKVMSDESKAEGRPCAYVSGAVPSKVMLFSENTTRTFDILYT